MKLTPLTLRSRHTRSPFEKPQIRYMYQDSSLPHPSTEGEGLKAYSTRALDLRR